MEDEEIPTGKIWVKPLNRGVNISRVMSSKKMAIFSFKRMSRPLNGGNLKGVLYMTGLRGLEECQEQVILPDGYKWNKFSKNTWYCSGLSVKQVVEIMSANDILDYIKKKGEIRNKSAIRNRAIMMKKISEEDS